MTGFRLFSMLMGHLLLRGNAYLRIESAGDQWATSLYPMHPDRVVPWEERGGDIIYRYTPPVKIGGRYAKPFEYLRGGQEVIHLRGLYSDDGIVGLSVLDLMKRHTDMVRNMERFGQSAFTRFPMLRGIIEWAGRFNAARRKEFRESFQATTSGPTGWGGVRVLDRGMQWKEVGLKPEELQWIDARAFAVSEFARWIGVPTALLFHTDKSSLYANVDRLIQAWGSLELAPWITNLEQELSYALLLTRELDDNLEIDLDDTWVLRGAPKDRAMYLKVMVEAGILTPNEAREYERLAPKDGGDELRTAKSAPGPGERDERAGEGPQKPRKDDDNGRRNDTEPDAGSSAPDRDAGASA